MRAAEMLDHKADLMSRLEDGRVYRAWRSQVEMDIRWENKTGTAMATTPEQDRINRANAAAILTTLKSDLPEAECFHVSEDMAALVQFAATQLDETDRFNPLMLPTRSGIVRFEKGIPWTDVRGKKMRLSWVVWGPILAQRSRHDVGEPSEYTHFWMWNDHFDEPDEVAGDMLAKFTEALGSEEAEQFTRSVWGRWGFMGGEYLTEGQRLGPAMRIPDDGKIAEVLADGDTPVAYTNPNRILHALWMLLGQTITLSTEAHLNRPTRKRAARARIPARVTVIQLRNIESRRAEGESLVEWSHRWIVRGHPAWRICGPNHPLAEEHPGKPGTYRCRVWIAPYPKGPKDAPLIVTDKVYALHR
jgi:hypothetical protein